MPKINVGGVWKNGVAYVNVGGIWKPGLVYLNVGGVWKAEYKTLGTLALGDKVYLTISGTAKQFLVIGKDHHAAGTVTLMPKDYCGATTYSAYRSGSALAQYDGSTLDVAMNTSFYGKLSAAEQALCQTVNIDVYAPAIGYYTLARKVFALSETETGCTAAAYVEGSRCLYFDVDDAGANTKRDSFYDGATAKSWWTRTCSSTNARQVNSSGYLGTQAQTSVSMLRAALVILSSQRISETPDGSGVYSFVT